MWRFRFQCQMNHPVFYCSASDIFRRQAITACYGMEYDVMVPKTTVHRKNSKNNKLILKILIIDVYSCWRNATVHCSGPAQNNIILFIYYNIVIYLKYIVYCVIILYFLLCEKPCILLTTIRYRRSSMMRNAVAAMMSK